MLTAEHVTKCFPLPDGGELSVLHDVHLNVREGEVVALLGRSGSGKSTLLRILAGLIPPSSGRVLMDDQPLKGPNPGVAMVFQSFALLPWLTVQQNAELGLLARGTERNVAEKEAEKALQMVGLEGFESAYPRELSGGMRQRVGFARAFVMRPEVLMMDEPFSALDVLTAENLRGEISDLWEKKTFPAKSILLVTHNIEESVMLSDRIVVLGANPGVVRGEVRVDLPRPRKAKDPQFAALVDHIYAVMTNPTATVGVFSANAYTERPLPKSRFPMLPHARVGGISGLLEIVNEAGGRADLPELAERLRLEVDDLLPTVDAAVMLGFAKVENGDVEISEEGREFATADVDRSRDLFAKQLALHVPFLSSMVETLRQKGDKTAGKDFFMDILDEHFTEKEAERQFEQLIYWGRYAGLFEYDAGEEKLYLVVDEPDDLPSSDV